MAQQAQRASVELFTQLYFKGKSLETDAYVIKVMAGGIVVLIPSYGIEGMIQISADSLAPGISYDQQQGHFISAVDNSVVLGLFQRVQIAIRTQIHEISRREQLVISLISPQLTSSSAISVIDEPSHKRSKSEGL